MAKLKSKQPEYRPTEAYEAKIVALGRTIGKTLDGVINCDSETRPNDDHTHFLNFLAWLGCGDNAYNLRVLVEQVTPAEFAAHPSVTLSQWLAISSQYVRPEDRETVIGLAEYGISSDELAMVGSRLYLGREKKKSEPKRQAARTRPKLAAV